MSDFLGDYVLKRRRAMFHFQTPQDLIQGFINTERQSVRGEPDPDGTKYLFRVPLQSVDPDWALIIGDFVYEQRGSLDYLITALIRSAGNQEHDASQFPIYGIDRIKWSETDAWWEADKRRTIERNLKGTPPGTKAALKELQPFYGVEIIYPGSHPLYVLQTLSNRDKHRRLNLLVRSADVEITDASGKPVFSFSKVRLRTVETDEGDAYTVTLNMAVDPEMDMYLVATHDIRFNEPPEVMGGVIETLTRINQFIDGQVAPAIRSLMP